MLQNFIEYNLMYLPSSVMHNIVEWFQKTNIGGDGSGSDGGGGGGGCDGGGTSSSTRNTNNESGKKK